MSDTPAIVFFDWDNTLCDTFPAIHDAYNHVLRTYGMDEWSVEKAKARIRKSGREAFPELFGDEWEKALAVYRGYYEETHPTSPLFDGVEELVGKLKAMGSKVGVISNKMPKLIKLNAEGAGVGGLFDVYVGAGEAAHDKPDPVMMKYALDKLGVNPAFEDIWYVGDTDIDMRFAANCGTKAVFVENTGYDSLEEMVNSYAPHRAYKTIRAFSDAL